MDDKFSIIYFRFSANVFKNMYLYNNLYFSVFFYVKASGSRVAVINDHTFSYHSQTKNQQRWACCNRESKGCPAFFTATKDDEIIRTKLEHNHLPSKYVICKGVYIKL